MNVLLVLVIMVAILVSIHPVRGIEEDEDYHGSEGSEHRFLGSEESKGSEGGEKVVKEKVVKAKVVTCYLDSSSLAKAADGGYYEVKFAASRGYYKVEAMEEATKYCTHIIYGFANLDSKTFKIKSHQPWIDLKTIKKATLCCLAGGKDCDAGNNYKLVTDLKTKNSKLKVLLAIGGAADSEGFKYSDLVADDTQMDTFIKDVKTFLTDHNFDGLDLNWQYPGKEDSKKCTIKTKDKANFVTWVKKLKVEFEKHNKDPVNVKKQLSLTAAVMPQANHAKLGYDIASLCKELDYIHLMTYNMHGPWDSKPTTVDHHAPLKSVKSSVNLWKKGCGEDNKHKLIVGVPLHGRTFTLKKYDKDDKTSYSIGAAASGMGTPGSITNQKGWISYMEICRNINLKTDGWTKVKGTEDIGPYAYGKDPSDTSKYTWVGYDDADMAEKKAKYVKEEKLGGVMVWSIDLADYDNTCGGPGGEKYPLLKKMSDEFKKKP